eukprot:m.203591 g.203591  ORF g.203591 m.203591 type:complete len:72 (-) comp13731_c13_seq1:1646-1861(-)
MYACMYVSYFNQLFIQLSLSYLLFSLLFLVLFSVVCFIAVSSWDCYLKFFIYCVYFFNHVELITLCKKVLR